MDLFEWQAKELFAKYGVPTTEQVVVTSLNASSHSAARIEALPSKKRYSDAALMSVARPMSLMDTAR